MRSARIFWCRDNFLGHQPKSYAMIKFLVSACLLLSRSSWGKSSAAFAPVAWLPSKRLSFTILAVSSSPSPPPPATPEDDNELPADFPRRGDVAVAIDAVRRACSVTRRLQPSGKKRKGDDIATVTKTDSSPVTIADFAAQAIVLDRLNATFGGDSFIAEESSLPLLRADPGLARSVLDATERLESTERLMECIDLGKSYLARDGEDGFQEARPRRVWCLDPIDGTKGFLRGKEEGGQYAVALALIEDGIPTIGVLGCPNLPISSTDEDNFAWDDGESEENNENTRGCVFVASRGGGCFQLPLFPTRSVETKRLRATANDGSAVAAPSDGRFCIGVEKGIADALGKCDEMAKILHGKDRALDEQGEIVKARRIDSMAKYAILARGEAEFYVRLPRPDYTENVWDHAAGSVVLEESGGKITDANGNPIDYGLGAKLSGGVRGILGSNGGVFHDALVRAYRQQERARQNGGIPKNPKTSELQ